MVTDRNVAYLGCIDPHHIPGDLDEIVAAGCNSITMTVDECDWTYYRRARRIIVREARARGLKLYVGLHGFGIFSSPIPSNQYPLEHPESGQVFNTGRHAVTACPNDAGFTTWLKGTVAEIIQEFKPDGMFWDEPAFYWSDKWPQEWACRCGNCQSGFAHRFGRPMPTALTPEVRQFRHESLLRFLGEVIQSAKENGGGESILCLMPWDRTGAGSISEGWYGVIGWEPFVQMPQLDVFSTDPYWINWQSFDYFETNAREAVKLARQCGKKCQIWVQAVQIPPGKEAEVKRTLLAAADMGADMLAVWSFRGERGSHVLDCGGDEELVWQMVSEAYHMLQTAEGREGR
jgi:hypothetical protein